MIFFTQSTAVLYKYLNDELKILCLLQFSPRLYRIPREFPEFSTFREIPEYSRFSRFVATLTEHSLRAGYNAPLTAADGWLLLQSVDVTVTSLWSPTEAALCICMVTSPFSLALWSFILVIDVGDPLASISTCTFCTILCNNRTQINRWTQIILPSDKPSDYHKTTLAFGL